jgi:hypothetical protein
MTDNISEELRRAVKLFNRWQFQEAFDAFSALTNEFDGRDKAFLEGITLLAAGFNRIWHKGGEPNAMVSYITKGVEVLKEHPRGGAGIQADGLVEALGACLEEAMRWRRGDEEIFNRDIIPRLEFKSGE